MRACGTGGKFAEYDQRASFKVIGIRTAVYPDPLEALFQTLYFLFKCMFLPEVGFPCCRETTYYNQLRILIGLERNCQQMR